MRLFERQLFGEFVPLMWRLRHEFEGPDRGELTLTVSPRWAYTTETIRVASFCRPNAVVSMRLLQRYIFAELLRVFAFVLSVLTVLFVFVGVFREVSDKGLGPLQVLQILPYVVPSLLPFTVPATMLLSVCVVYGRMAGDQEITAAKSAGISMMSLLWPSLFFGGVLSVCTLWLTDQVIPWSEANIRRVVTAAMEDILLDVLRSQHQTTDWSQGVTISVKDVRGKKLIKPTFRYSPTGKPPLTANAQEA